MRKKTEQAYGFCASTLRVIMAQKNIGTMALAKKMDRTPATISKWRGGKTSPSITDIATLGKIFGIDYKTLML